MSERQPVHPSGHVYVCEDEPDFFMKLERAECFCGIVRLIYLKPFSFEDGCNIQPDKIVILYDENRNALASSTVHLLETHWLSNSFIAVATELRKSEHFALCFASLNQPVGSVLGSQRATLLMADMRTATESVVGYLERALGERWHISHGLWPLTCTVGTGAKKLA